MSYKDALDLLYNSLPMYQKVGFKAHTNKLDNIIFLCNYLGNPQNSFKSIHIAGTNGKGSSVAILTALLTAKKIKVGCYTSPHLFDFRERIKVGESLITKEAVVTFVNKISSKIKEHDFSFFEITVAMAFWFFKIKNVDIAIIETGLGGRLDSTNIITPIITIITSIGLDHQDILGETIHEITHEKAGIIKDKVPCILNKNDICVRNIVESKALEKESELYYSEDYFSITKEAGSILKIKYIPRNSIKLDAIDDFYPLNIDFVLKGIHQIENLKGVLLAYHLLCIGGKPTREDFYKGFELLKKNEYTPLGRCQTISLEPRIICDVSHNLEGIKALFKMVKEIKYENLYCIIAFSKDKKIDAILPILPRQAKYYIPQVNQSRLLKSKSLYNKLRELGYSVVDNKNSVGICFKKVNEKLTNKDLLLIFGSFFLFEDLCDIIKLSLNSS